LKEDKTMLRGLYTAYTGMEVQQYKMDIISNNLANANTNGFKQDNVVFRSFSEVLATKINDPETNSNRKIGKMTLGVSLDNVYTNFEQGAFNVTDDPFTFALEGDGLFTVGKQKEDGTFEEFFTRDGSFTLTQNGELVTKDGYYVLGENGIITVPIGVPTVDQAGKMYVNNEYVAQMQMTGFENLLALHKIGDNLFLKTDNTEKSPFTGVIRQGFNEASNVNSVKEMIELINIMRSYKKKKKVLTTYDGTLENVVNNVGRVN